MFTQACVIPFDQGSASRGMGAGGLPPVGKGGSASKGRGLPRDGGRPPVPPETHGILRVMVNKWVERILPECILILCYGWRQ